MKIDLARTLDPIDRLSEALFGVLMASTFTSTMKISLGEGATVNSVLFAALACNTAWGIIDAVMYCVSTYVERGREALATAEGAEAARMGRVKALLTGSDILGSLVVFVIVVAAALPLALPFLFFDDVNVATRFSDVIAVVLLFIIGVALGRQMGQRGWAFGLVIAAIGAVLTGIAIALGG